MPMDSTICLCMIVRDEARIIERCCKSVLGLIDSYVIVDTGSTDDTIERIRHALRDVQGEIYHRTWVNFGHNRSELMHLARGRADWLLLIDADMTVEHDGPPTLAGDVDSYMLRHADDPEYWIKRLVRGGLRWEYVGATHEYINAPGHERSRRLDALTIHHHGDGMYRKDKFERDLKLLSEDLERDPENTRTVFYIANTLRDLGRIDDAVERYLQRAEMGGWGEEVYVSLYEAGRLKQDVALLFRAWCYRSQRIEPLYELARLFRERKQWQAAHLVAVRGLTMPIPEDSLFLHRWVYEWGLLFEYSIASWWVGEMEEARSASDHLLTITALPETYRGQVLANRSFLPEELAQTDGQG